MAVTAQQIQMARKAGYSDDEIVSHLAATEPQMKTALSAGYSPSEIMAHFDSAKPASKDGRTPSYDNRVTDKAEIERRRREFVQNTGTLATRAKDVVNQAFNPEVQIPAADSVGDFATRVLPQSLTQLGPKMIRGAYDAIKGQTDPIVNSLSSLRPTGQLPGPQMERNAGRTVTGLAEAMTAPTGLMGADKAKEAWLTDPAGSALAISPLVKPSLRTLGKVADTATAIPSAAVADTARAAANKLTDMTLKQSTVLKPEIRAKNVKTALEGGFLPNSKGVDTLNNTIAATEKALADGIAAGDAAQVKGTLDKAISNVESLREKANRSSDPAANNALIDAEIQRLQSHPLLDETGAVNIGTLQKMKVEQGRELAKTYGGEKATQFQNSIDKARVRGMKEELESALDGAFPELAATNRKLGDYYNLKKSLERAANRIENNQGIGIGLPIKGGAGATMGGMLGGPAGAAIGGGVGTLIGIIEHPAVAPRLALQLYKVSKGKMTMKEAKATVKQRLADIAFIDYATKKGKDQRGMVGKDIDAPDYKGEHTAPMRDSGAPLHDLVGPGIYPDDVYGPRGLQYYGTGMAKADAESMAVIRQLHNKPDKLVTIYRAVPKELTNAEKLISLDKQMSDYLRRNKLPKDAFTNDGSKWYDWAYKEREILRSLPDEAKPQKIEINKGDWVTLSRSYAADHGKSALNGQYKIVSKKVKAKDIYTNGDSLNEWGYDPD